MRTRIRGNLIGTDVNGVAGGDTLGNLRHGVWIENAAGNIIGGTDDASGNTIAFNGSVFGQQGHGVEVSAGNRNAIRHNSIFSNYGRGIDLGSNSFDVNDPGDGDGGANNGQNYPEWGWQATAGGATTLQIALNSTPNRRFTLELFGNTGRADPRTGFTRGDPSGFGEGEVFLGEFTLDTNDAGLGILTLGGIIDDFVTATVTDAFDNTSEFSIVDTDGDAVADAWELLGIDFDEDGNPDLRLMSTHGEPAPDPDHKDLFVEVDAIGALA